MTDPQKAAFEPCPFCASDNIVKKFTCNGEYEDAECLDCGAEHNIGMWNTRHLRTSSPVEVTVEEFMEVMICGNQDALWFAEKYPHGLKIITPPQAKE